MKKHNLIKKIAFSSIMAAIAVVLNLISVRTDESLFTIYALPLLVSGILYGPISGFLSGLATGIIVQLFTYGIGPTTIFWILAPISWGLISGIISKIFKNKINATSIICNVVITSFIALFLNSLAMILDGLYYQYPTEYVFTNLYIRIAASCIVGVFYCFILLTIVPRIAKINPFTNKKDSNNVEPIKDKNKNKPKLKVKIIINE